MANPDRYVLIDVRNEAEFSERHIPGASNIPIASLLSCGLDVAQNKVALSAERARGAQQMPPPH